MKTNPLKEGNLSGNSASLGTVTHKWVRERAVELAGVVWGVMLAASCSVAANGDDGDLSAEPTALFSLSKDFRYSLAIERRQAVADGNSLRWETPPEIQADSVRVRRLIHELFGSEDGPMQSLPSHRGLLQESAVVLGEVRFAYGPFFRPDTGLASGRLGLPWQEPSYLQVKIGFLF
jgi:hypothetical protein